jgi:digalactosyldiacylglycerol synthase
MRGGAFDEKNAGDNNFAKPKRIQSSTKIEGTNANNGSRLHEIRAGSSDQKNNGAKSSANKAKKTKQSRPRRKAEEMGSTRLHRKVRQKVRRGRHKLKATVKATLAKTTLPSREAFREWSMWTNHTNNKAKATFYDRIELVTQALLRSEMDATVSSETDHDDTIPSHDLEITHQSDLTRPGRKVFVVTTASLPWFTGTAVNPLLRAAYLCRKLREINKHNSTLGEPGERQWVTLVIPWLELEEDRLELYGLANSFANETVQEQHIRSWLRDEAGMPDEADEESGLRILWYPARYHPGLKSIFAMGDLISLIPEEDANVVVLEEPEHLNWYRPPGDGWAKKFEYSVGIVHTNYVSYASSQYHGLWTAPAIALMSSAMIRAYCHKVIKLSGVLQSFAPEKEMISNVHGVRTDFLDEGRRRGNETLSKMSNGEDANDADDSVQAYFIGKLLWAKGLDKMLELQDFYRQVTGEYFSIDIYGSGPEQKEIMRGYHGRKHATSSLAGNANDEREESPSQSDESVNEETHAEPLRGAQPSIPKISSSLESVQFDLPSSRHEFRRRPIPATFPGRVDHASVKRHKIFINPSVTEVLCTTTAEALAMGKFAIIPYHPSNMWFRQFPNCLMYRNKWEFAASLKWAQAHDPEPLTPELAHQFSWEAATERFIKAAAITRHEARKRAQRDTTKLDERMEWFHKQLGKSDALRSILGGGPVAKQVAWTKEKSNGAEGDESTTIDGGIGGDESQDEKFIGSSLADAISQTLANLVPFEHHSGIADDSARVKPAVLTPAFQDAVG